MLAAVGLALTDQLTFSVQGGPYWRYSANDAVYGVGGNIVRASDMGSQDSSDAKFIGTQFEFVAEWSPVRELAFLLSYSLFQPGEFIKETGPSETTHFFSLEAVFNSENVQEEVVLHAAEGSWLHRAAISSSQH